MKNHDALAALCLELKPSAVSEESRKLVLEQAMKAGLQLDSDLAVRGSVSEAQIRDFANHLGAVKVVWKVIAKRVLRKFDIII